MAKVTGKIVNIQNFSLHDGPGIRTTVFFKGCPLRCLWCANPDTQERSLQLLHSVNQCTQCRECIPTCSEKAISWGERITIDRDACTLCGECIAICPGSALRIDAEVFSLQTVFEKIQKEIPFYRNSGGGVTLSGGEPLFQPAFAEAIVKKCQQWGLHTAIETSGFASYETLKRISEWLDLIYFDLKHLDDTIHRDITGVSNSLILGNLKKISKVHSGVIVRIPVIPTLNNSADHLMKVGEFLKQETGVTSIEFLNYHKLGEHKYHSLGRAYSLAGLEPLSTEEFEDTVRNFQATYPDFTIIYHN